MFARLIRSSHFYDRFSCRQIRWQVSNEIESILIRHVFLLVESHEETNGTTAKFTEVILFGNKTLQKQKNNI